MKAEENKHEFMPTIEEMLPEATDSQLFWFITGCKEVMTDILNNGPFTEANRVELKGFAKALHLAIQERDKRKLTGPVFGFEA